MNPKSPFFKDYETSKHPTQAIRSPLLSPSPAGGTAMTSDHQVALSKQAKQPKKKVLSSLFREKDTNSMQKNNHPSVREKSHTSIHSEIAKPKRSADISGSRIKSTQHHHKKAFSKHSPTITLENFDTISILLILLLPIFITILLYTLHASFRYDSWSVDFQSCMVDSTHSLKHIQNSMYCSFEKNQLVLQNIGINLYPWDNFIRTELFIQTNPANTNLTNHITLPQDLFLHIGFTLPSNETVATFVNEGTLNTNLWTLYNTTAHQQTMKISFPFIAWQTFQGVLPVINEKETKEKSRKLVGKDTEEGEVFMSTRNNTAITIDKKTQPTDPDIKSLEDSTEPNLIIPNPLSIIISFANNSFIQAIQQNEVTLIMTGYSYSEQYAIAVAIETIVIILLLVYATIQFCIHCIHYAKTVSQEIQETVLPYTYQRFISTACFLLPEQYYLIFITISFVGTLNIWGSIWYLWIMYCLEYSTNATIAASKLSSQTWFWMILLQSYCKYCLLLGIVCYVQGLRYNSNRYEEINFQNYLHEQLQLEYGYGYDQMSNGTETTNERKDGLVRDETTSLLPTVEAKVKELRKLKENLNTDQMNSMIHHLYSLYLMKHHPVSKQLLDFLCWKLLWWMLSCTMITIYWYLFFHHHGTENVSDDMVMMAIIDQNNSLYIWIKVLEYWISIQNLLWFLYILKGFWETSAILKHIRYMQSRIRQICFRVLFNQLLIGIVACIGLTMYFYYHQQHTYFFHDTTQYTSSHSKVTTDDGSSIMAQTLLQYYYFFSYWIEYYGVMTTTLYSMPQNTLILLPNEGLCYIGVLIACTMYSFLPCSWVSSTTDASSSTSRPTTSMISIMTNNFFQSLLVPQQKKMMIVFQDEYDTAASTRFYHHSSSNTTPTPFSEPGRSTKVESPGSSRWDNYGSFVETTTTPTTTLSDKDSTSPIDELSSYFFTSKYHKKLIHEPFCLEIACYLLEVSYQTYFPLHQKQKTTERRSSAVAGAASLSTSATGTYRTGRSQSLSQSQPEDHTEKGSILSDIASVLSFGTTSNQAKKELLDTAVPGSGSASRHAYSKVGEAMENFSIGSATLDTFTSGGGPTLDLQAMGLQLHDIFQCPVKNIFGLLSESNDIIVIAFRGSTVENIATDLMFTQMLLPPLQHEKDYFLHLFNNSYGYNYLQTVDSVNSFASFASTTHGGQPRNSSSPSRRRSSSGPSVLVHEESLFSWSLMWKECTEVLTTIPVINQTFPRIHIGFWKAYESIRSQYMKAICLFYQDKVAAYFQTLVEDGGGQSSGGDHHKEERKWSMQEEHHDEEDAVHMHNHRTYSQQQRMKNIMQGLQRFIMRKKIHFAGHSLGAALASLAALELSMNMETMMEVLMEKYCPHELWHPSAVLNFTSLSYAPVTDTFHPQDALSTPSFPRHVLYELLPPMDLYQYGSPRIGNPIFAQIMNRFIPNAFRVQVDGDLVTMIPKLFGFYRHFGKVIILEELSEGGHGNGNILIEPNIIEYSFFRRMVGNFQNHSLDKYRLCLEACFEPDEYRDYLAKEAMLGNGCI